MKHSRPSVLRRIGAALNHLSLRALVAIQVFASTEPVRFRSALTSVLIAAGVLIPALHDGHTAQTVAGVVVVALPVVVGESARKRVSPSN